MFLCLLVGFCCCFLLWFYYNLVSVLIYSVRNITFYFLINRYFGVNLLASQTLTQPPISVHTKLRMGKINMQLSPNIILSKSCFDWNQLTLKSIFIFQTGIVELIIPQLKWLVYNYQLILGCYGKTNTILIV